jgi:hypothetical protein
LIHTIAVEGAGSMNVTAIHKNGDPRDPTRDALRAAIAARTTAEAEAEQHQQAIRRAHNMVHEAEQRLTVAGEALEKTRSDHAGGIARAATVGTAPKADGALRAARLVLADAEDEAQAARSALEQLHR